MSTNTGAATALRDEFAALLDESFGGGDAIEGTVVKGTVVGVENDVVVIDVGLKSEGRIPLREFAGFDGAHGLSVGDEVEVFVDRVENANGEAMLSRDRALLQLARPARELGIRILTPAHWRQALRS